MLSGIVLHQYDMLSLGVRFPAAAIIYTPRSETQVPFATLKRAPAETDAQNYSVLT
jgi:hypothetical protein